jgi:hypothetical protein
LTIDNGDAQFLGLRRVEQHSFHFLLPRSMHHGMGKTGAPHVAARAKNNYVSRLRYVTYWAGLILIILVLPVPNPPPFHRNGVRRIRY